MGRALILLTLAGCAFDRSGVQASGGVQPDAEVVTIDASVDADPTMPDGTPVDADPGTPDAEPCVTWAALNVDDPCDPAIGEPGTLTLTGGRNRYDTDTGILTGMGGSTSIPSSVLIAQPGGPEVRALVLASLDVPVGTGLIVSGSRPLIAIVFGDASVAGAIDVSATLDGTGAISTPGAGGDDPGECGNGAGDVGNDSTGTGGAGGGGGGAFGGDAGDGGDGNGNNSGGKGGKGSANGNTSIVPLRGGCGGGDGGNTLAGNGARGGSGGGGFELTARGTITVTGTIAAGGTGGAGPALFNTGGGGAGSGGAILLDGADVSVAATAALCANGGGGGEGGATSTTADPGDDAGCVETPRANGGASAANGGDGGDGGVLGGVNGANGSNGTAGGGGGGGGASVGRIRVRGRTTRTVDAAAIVSPGATS